MVLGVVVGLVPVILRIALIVLVFARTVISAVLVVLLKVDAVPGDAAVLDSLICFLFFII